MRLPEGADEENTKARYDKGILDVTVPVSKAEAATSRAIPIKAE